MHAMAAWPRYVCAEHRKDSQQACAYMDPVHALARNNPDVSMTELLLLKSLHMHAFQPPHLLWLMSHQFAAFAGRLWSCRALPVVSGGVEQRPGRWWFLWCECATGIRRSENGLPGANHVAPYASSANLQLAVHSTRWALSRCAGPTHSTNWWLGACLSTLIPVIYSFTGGMRASVMTDMSQV